MMHDEAFIALCERASAVVKEVTLEDAIRWAHAPDTWLIDVREDHEWEQGHIPNAHHLGRGILERDIATQCADKSARIILYCGGGYRSVLAAESLQAMGYQQVYSLQGGFRAWKNR